jgi:SNF2 family DNA or RNA helicase
MSWMAQKKRNESSKKKFEPHNYQLEGIKWLLQKSFAGLFWDPGLGKTSTVLHAFKILKEQNYVDTLIIVAKRRIIYKVWPEEVKKWRLPFKTMILHGTQEHRHRSMKTKADVYLLNFENLQWFASKHKDWRRRFGRIMFVVDESTKLRNISAKRFKSLRHKLKYFDRRVILTGTPTPNGIMNLYGQMFLLDEGEALGRYIGQFRNKWFHPTGYGGYKWVPNDGAEDEIYKAISHRILRVDGKTANLKLPKLMHVTRSCVLNEEARRLYDSFEDEMLALWKDEMLVAKSAAVLNNKLRQVANGAIYKQPSEFDDEDRPDDQKRKVIEIHGEKIDELIELLEELNGKPALIAYEFTHDRERIAEAILSNSEDLRRLLPTDKNGKPFVPYIGGGTKDRDANDYIDMWNGELPILLGHPESIAHGLNMQGTHGCVIFFAVPWDLENYLQMIQRVYRQGQKHTVFVYHIVAEDTVDEVVVATIARKNKDQQKLLNAMLEFAQQRRAHVQEEDEEAKANRRAVHSLGSAKKEGGAKVSKLKAPA